MSLFMVLFISMGLGCAGTRKTNQTKIILNHPNEGVVYQENPNKQIMGLQSIDQGETSKREITTVTTETKDEHPGVLKSTLYAIGYVISIPFIIVRGVFRTIFGG